MPRPTKKTMRTSRQVLRLTQKVRREYEHPESAQLNFEATFCGIFSLWLPCWAQIWIVQHKNSVFLMRNRIHTQNSQRNHLLSLILSSGTLFDKWISHIRRMDLSFAGVLFLYNSTLQLVRLTWNDHTSKKVQNFKSLFVPASLYHAKIYVSRPKMDVFAQFTGEKSIFFGLDGRISSYCIAWTLPSSIFINIWWTHLCWRVFLAITVTWSAQKALLVFMKLTEKIQPSRYLLDMASLKIYVLSPEVFEEGSDVFSFHSKGYWRRV